MQNAEDFRAGADSGAESAESRVYGDRTKHRVRWGHYIPPYGRRLVVSLYRPGSVLACRGRVVHGGPYAGRVGEPGIGDGARPAAARSGAHHAYGPWQSIWRRQLSAAPDPARDTTEYEPEGQLLGQRGGGELLSYLKDRIDLSG